MNNNNEKGLSPEQIKKAIQMLNEKSKAQEQQIKAQEQQIRELKEINSTLSCDFKKAVERIDGLELQVKSLESNANISGKTTNNVVTTGLKAPYPKQLFTPTKMVSTPNVKPFTKNTFNTLCESPLLTQKTKSMMQTYTQTSQKNVIENDADQLFLKLQNKNFSNADKVELIVNNIFDFSKKFGSIEDDYQNKFKELNAQIDELADSFAEQIDNSSKLARKLKF